MSLAGGWGGGMGGMGGGRLDRGLRMSLTETLRLAWADPDLRSRIKFVMFLFAIYAIGIHVPVPIPGIDPARLEKLIDQSAFLGLLNMFGGGAFKKISIFALGLSPYITSSIIMQVLTMATPAWKKEMQEGGEYARKQQNKRTRILTLVLCAFQSFTLFNMLGNLIGHVSPQAQITTAIFWTAGAMFLLWLGEQMSEKGIGNGVSLLIFAGIVISMPNMVQNLWMALGKGFNLLQLVLILVIFLGTTYFIVAFTIAQRRIPIQHMRRNFGTKAVGGLTSYLPISVNMAGVIPIIFAVALIYMPSQMTAMFPTGTWIHDAFIEISKFTNPDFTNWKGYVGVLLYAGLIFFFTYFWNAMMYNVEDIANNLKRGGSYIPGIRPGKQTKDFLDGVISRVTFVGALCLSIVAMTQYLFPVIAPQVSASVRMVGGTSLLIMVSVALETMRQIESNLIMKQYNQ
jgi:preprotein translocase subunit SecY